ncbi:MAG: type II toxin-antitoxin system VapC family toxin [Syntrophobacteraceae bacterium]|nr:type II toxin-antitoxin system VapC family toxin [Syntrophobacteraceae bacterium]
MSRDPAESYVFDTSALLTLWNDEEGADEVERLLRSGAVVYVSFMTCMEGRYRLWKNVGHEESDEFSRYLDLMPLQRIDLTPRIFETAIEIKATNSLSVCDSWIAATAVATESILVHKDPEFEPLKTIVKLKPLPYKALS